MYKPTILFVLIILLSGCGQKGPLYHSQPEPEVNKPEPESNKSEPKQSAPQSESTKDNQ